MKIRPVGVEFHADRRTGGRTDDADMTKEAFSQLCKGAE